MLPAKPQTTNQPTNPPFVSIRFPQTLSANQQVGLSHLNAAIEAGERLYPDTAAPGREKVRQQLRTARDVGDAVVGDLAEAQRHHAATATLWASFSQGQQDVERWLLEAETWVKADSELRNSLQEKRSQLQNMKVS